MFKAMTLLVAVLATTALVWVAGELHRSNCLRAGRTACSVLMWNDGKPKPPPRRHEKLPLGGGSGKLPL